MPQKEEQKTKQHNSEKWQQLKKVTSLSLLLFSLLSLFFLFSLFPLSLYLSYTHFSPSFSLSLSLSLFISLSLPFSLSSSLSLSLPFSLSLPLSLFLSLSLPLSLHHSHSLTLSFSRADALATSCVCCISKDLLTTPHTCPVCGEEQSDRDAALRHLLTLHNLVIGELEQIADLPA